ncbi:MAG: malonate transporter subunit MadL [Rhodospirillales bacterium]
MTIFGVAIMAFCTLLGEALGELLGQALNVKANVGGVGLAMIFLICARLWLARRGALTSGIKLGVEFWATMYIPIVVAMAAQQNVVAAVRGGPVVLIAGIVTFVVCGAILALLGKISPSKPLPEEKTEHVHVFVEGMDPTVDEPPLVGGPVVSPTAR